MRLTAATAFLGASLMAGDVALAFVAPAVSNDFVTSRAAASAALRMAAADDKPKKKLSVADIMAGGNKKAEQDGLPAHVYTRSKQDTTAYWDHVQDALADLVRIMLQRCFDKSSYPELYEHCRNLRGEVFLAYIWWKYFRFSRSHSFVCRSLGLSF